MKIEKIIPVTERMSQLIEELKCSELPEDMKKELYEELGRLCMTEEGRVILASVAEKPRDMTWADWFNELRKNI